eukprot:UN26437
MNQKSDNNPKTNNSRPRKTDRRRHKKKSIEKNNNDNNNKKNSNHKNDKKLNNINNIKTNNTAKSEIVYSYENRGLFGEIALLYTCPRSASVISKSEGVLWMLDKSNFRNIIRSRSNMRRKHRGFLKSVPLFSELNDIKRSQIADCMDV